MNYSNTPIIFRNQKYDTVKQAMEETGLSRYMIKKEAEYVNPEDKLKFKNFGRSRKIPDQLPTKEEIEKVYTGNAREAASKLGITEYVMRQLIEQYEIKQYTLSESKILKSDQNRPSKEKLVKQYNEMAIHEILNYYGIGYGKLMRWFKQYGIQKRPRGGTASIKHEMRHNNVKPSCETLKAEYEKKSIHELSLEYGVNKPIISAWLKEYDIDVSTNASRAENELFEYCYKLDDSFIQGDRRLINPLELDIVSHKHRLAIEYCGVYWHSAAMGKGRNYHKQKYNLCKDKGYKLLTIFETDNQEKVRALIRSCLGYNNRVFARNTVISEINSKEASQFHKKHHLSNSVGGRVHLGLYYRSQLVMVATFSKTRYNRNVEYECARMTSHSDYTVVGGASKLFSHFFSKYNVQSCITYADLRFGDGSVYSDHCGFYRGEDTGPNYFYFKSDELELYSRVKFQKHKLKNLLDYYDDSKTEYENMTLNGYDKIWDCGNGVYYCYKYQYGYTNRTNL